MRQPSLLFFSALLLVCHPPGHAQVVLPNQRQALALEESVFGLGFAGGAASGIGLSFRHHLPGELSYQATGGIIKVDGNLHYSIGAGAQYDLIRTSLTRVFFGGGLGYYYSGDNGDNELDAPARMGLGVGGEMEVSSGFHVIGEALFTYFTDGTILPLPQVGVYYYFY
jgi:hypothetical protein